MPFTATLRIYSQLKTRTEQPKEHGKWNIQGCKVLVTGFSFSLYTFLSFFFLFSFFCSVKEITTPIEHTSYRKQHTYSLEDNEGNTHQFQNSSIIPQLWTLCWLCTLHQNYKGTGLTSARLNTWVVKGRGPAGTLLPWRAQRTGCCFQVPPGAPLGPFQIFWRFLFACFWAIFMIYQCSCKALCGNITQFPKKRKPGNLRTAQLNLNNPDTKLTMNTHQHQRHFLLGVYLER